MQVTKVICQYCGRKISKTNIRKHETSCVKRASLPNYFPADGSLNCIFCGKTCKNKNSLVNHSRLCRANPQRNLTGGLVDFNIRRKVDDSLV